MNFKEIHIGRILQKAVTESGIEMSRICNYFKTTEKEINDTFLLQDISTDVLLKWSKLLSYDFFRIYTQHLVLYSPPSARQEENKTLKTNLPTFRKNIYTQEVIEFILEQINSKKMTKKEVVERYNIPKTTLYKWISKYSKQQI